MSGNDSDNTFCSEASRIMKRRKVQKKAVNHSVLLDNTSLRRSTRIKEQSRNNMTKYVIKKRTKKNKKQKPRKLDYIDTVKNIFFQLNDVIYKHISRKKIITQNKAENVVKQLNKMKIDNTLRFNDDVEQVWEKLMRQFKSIAFSHETDINSQDIISLSETSENSCETIKSSSQSFSNFQNDFQSTQHIIQSNPKILPIDILPSLKSSANIEATNLRKPSNSPKNTHKSIVTTQRNTAYQNKSTIYNIDSIINHETSKFQRKSNEQNEIIQTAGSIKKAPFTSIQINDFEESQSILSNYNTNFITPEIAYCNNDVTRNDLTVRNKSISNSRKNGDILKNVIFPYKMVIENGNNASVSGKIQREGNISILTGQINESSHFPESQSILVNYDIIPVSTDKTVNSNNKKLEKCVKSNDNLEKENDLRQCCEMDISTYENLVSQDTINKNLIHQKETLNSSNMVRNRYSENIFDKSVCTRDLLFLSEETNLDTENTQSIPEGGEKTDLFKQPLPTLTYSEIVTKDTFLGIINGTETVVETNTTTEIDNNIENIFDSMHHFSLDQVMPIANANDFPTDERTQHSVDQSESAVNIINISFNSDKNSSQDQISKGILQTLTGTIVDSYSWLKDINKCRKYNNNKYPSKNDLSCYNIQNSQSSPPLDLENEFKW